MKNIKVSIITVCFNSKKTIRKTIESVLNQTYQNIEYIIVDGKSTDGTVAIIDEYMPAFQGRLTLISEPDEGIYDAMNKGISLASGSLIGILNSDDYYEKNAVEIMVNAMKDDKYQILYGFVRMIKMGEEYSVERLSHNFLCERMIGHPACFVTQSVYRDFGCFDLQYISVADYDFMLRMSQHEEIHFIPVDAVIADFTLGGMSASAEAWLDLLKLRKNYGIITQKEYRKYTARDRIYKLYKKILICIYKKYMFF